MKVNNVHYYTDDEGVGQLSVTVEVKRELDQDDVAALVNMLSDYTGDTVASHDTKPAKAEKPAKATKTAKKPKEVEPEDDDEPKKITTKFLVEITTKASEVLTPKAVKRILGKFDVDELQDLDEEDRAEYVKILEAKIEDEED